MRELAGIEDIEELRRLAGIDDVELRHAIRALRIGDFVVLTVLAGPEVHSGQQLLVRITSIRGSKFRGRITEKPGSADLSKADAGALVAFTTAHIHSLQKKPVNVGTTGATTSAR